MHPLLKGTVDFGYVSRKFVMHLRDYKNGEGIGVAAPGNNAQLLLWLPAHHGDEPRDRRPETPVTLGIVQPNFYGIFEAPDVWETDLGTVLDWGHDVLLPRMNALMAPEIDDGDFVSGTHCQFCPVMLECPKLQRALKEYANGEEFVAMLPDQEIDRLYSLREDARRFMNALGDVVYARKLAGSNIASAKLVEKQTRRVWKVGAEARACPSLRPARLRSCRS
jgi:hypothetical protein